MHIASDCLFLHIIFERLKKLLKISGYLVLTLLGLALLTAVLVNIPLVQNWLVKQVTYRLSKDLNTTVKIKHIDFDLALFNKMSLEGTMIADHRKDTLLYAGEVNVRITDWFFLKNKITLKYIGLKDAYVNLHRIDSVWNYQFLLDYFAAPPSTKKKKGIDLDLKIVDLNNIHFLQKDEWRGEDRLFDVRTVHVDAKQINLSNKTIDISEILLEDPFFTIYNYPGLRPKRVIVELEEEPIVNDSVLTWNPEAWNMSVTRLSIKNGIFKSTRKSDREPYYYFDDRNMLFSKINSSITNIKLTNDTVTAGLVLSAAERSGFVIRSFQSDIKMHPRGMEFADLDIKTNKSHLKNFFAMRYRDFDDMGSFIEKVRLEGIFKDSELDSDDIAFFAPAVKSWKKRIFITGTVKGSVSDLTARNLTVKAGKNTVLHGDIKIAGLPDIDKAFIDFKANDFLTTYTDATTFIPSLKKIDEPRLDRLGNLRFRGYFTGFIHDFITYGTITTNLGALELSDVNVRLSSEKDQFTGYSGKLKTSDFNIGSLLDNGQVGRISFNGSVRGAGSTLGNLQAQLDGDVSSLEFMNYRYKNIKVKGTLAKRLFNGAFVADDANLGASLNGLIDFSGPQPRFDFIASVEKLNLKRLNLYRDDIDFNGQLLFNFSGSTIDNFLGSAKIFNASVFKDGQRISFDSLSVLSEMNNDYRKIAVRSNEFDAELAGEFAIRELPNAFQIFLNRYYPSYINPSRKQLVNNENFSFVITTKKIDDYISLLDNKLKGFNNTSLMGRINAKDNLFELNAEVPQFAYKNISFSNVTLIGSGNYDTLTLNTRIADVFVNDSLHFPGTEISVQSSQDLSKVNILTSANQTLNSANISGQVQTLKNGVRVQFNPSSFDINGKTWSIDKDGELILSRELITTNDLRISNAEQEVYITSVPSSLGNTNDLRATLKNINIGDFAPFFVKSNRLEGLLSGTVDVADPFENLHVEVKAEAGFFRLDDDSLGKLELNASYSGKSGKLNAGVISANENYDFDMRGIFELSDSTKTDVDLKFDLRNTNIHILEKYLSGIFSNLSGKATGNLQITGPSRNLKYLGDIQLKDAGLMVKYTKCAYKIPSARVKLNDGSIDFGSFTIKDTLNNSGEIVNGKLYHQAFKDLSFDFRLRSNQLLLLNTSAADNNQFYGNVVGKVNMSFTGPLEDMNMDIKGEPTDTSNIYLPIGSSRESGEAGFIIWKVYGREMQDEDLKLNESNLTVLLDLTANRYANVFVILDELTGDIIAANGNGNLKLRVGTREEMTMSGRFNIERGNYTFSFQSLKRNFRLRENAGSYISWNGDPLDASINIEAEYEAANVRFSDLLTGSNLASAANEDVKRYRGKVLVVATLTERLTAPHIAFRIELPPDSPIRSSPDVATIFSFIQNDVNELNKQVSFLILFNTFGPYTGGGSRGGTGNIANMALEGIVVNSISGFLSNILTNEFSNILQDIFKDKSLKVNINASLYSGSNLIDNYNQNQITLPDRTNFNLSIGKSFFNERLTFIVGGALDFGLNTAQQNQSSAFPFLPDVVAEWKLTPDGKFRLTFFYRENYSYMGTGGKQNRSGSSISFRKEFDRIDELFKKGGKAARKPGPAGPKEPELGSRERE